MIIMKPPVVAAFVLWATGLFAQPFTHSLYILGFGATGPFGAAVNGTYIHSSGWGGTVALHGWSAQAQGVESDFNPWQPMETLMEPTDDYRAWSFRAVRTFPTKTEKVRWGLEAGPSFVKGWEPPNKHYDEVSTALGLSLRAKAEFPLTRFFGLEAGAQANLNGLRTYFGVDVMFTLGWLRE